MPPKLARTKIVTIRLDPKLHYFAVLSARIQRRTLSAFIEGVLAEAYTAEVERLWHVDPEQRFIRLAQLRPDLLTFDEHVRWASHPENRAKET